MPPDRPSRSDAHRPKASEVVNLHAAGPHGVGSTQPIDPAPPSLFGLMPFIRPYWRRVALSVVALVAAATFMLLLGQSVRVMVDHGMSGGIEALDQAAAGIFVLIVGLAGATACRYYQMSWLGERVTADLRSAVFERLMQLSPEFFETTRTGEVLSRLSADTALLQSVIGSVVSQWLRNFIMLVGALVMLVVTSPMLALSVVAATPVVLVPVMFFGRRERRLSRTAQDRIADISAYAEETVNAIRTVHAFNHAEHDVSRFRSTVEESVVAALRRIRTRSLVVSIVIVLGCGSMTLGVWAGGVEVLEGRMSAGQLTSFLFYAVMLGASVATVTELWGDLKRAGGAAERLLELLAERPSLRVPASPLTLPTPPQGRVAFENVTFTYPARPDQPALHALSFTVEPGETVALVGPSGAGKSTVFQLLMRFYDPQSGRVLIDGVSVSDALPEAVRSRLAIVPQEPVVFGTNAWENIRYGRPDATDAEVRAAADAAFATEFLERLPNGFDTFLGEKGVRLSGGQRQRLAIARAILRNPPILLLDEATSALDAASERAVQDALNYLARGRTMLVIAHRLATVRKANRIIVINDGRVVATGTHDALIREGGLYAELAALQFTADVAA